MTKRICPCPQDIDCALFVVSMWPSLSRVPVPTGVHSFIHSVAAYTPARASPCVFEKKDYCTVKYEHVVGCVYLTET